MSTSIADLLAATSESVKELPLLVKKVEEAAKTKAMADSAKRSSFPLRPSSAMKSERDLYYGLCNHFNPGSVTVDPVRNPILLSLGHAIEKHLVGHLEEAFEVAHKNQSVDYGSVIDPADDKEIRLTGELDFCLINGRTGEVVLCDSKSSSAWAFTKAPLPKEEHIAQLHCYLHSKWARDLNITRALLWYYNKDKSTLRCFEFTYNPSLAEAVIARFQSILNNYRLGTKPPREHVYGQDWQAAYSSFKTEDLREFTVPVDARERVEDAVLNFDDMPKTKIIRYIATVYGGKVVNGHYLEVGNTGLELSLETKEQGEQEDVG